MNDNAGSQEKPAWMNCVVDREIAPAADDGWGDEVGTGGYNAQARIEADPNIIYNPQGLTPAERRDFKWDRAQRATEALQNKSDNAWQTDDSKVHKSPSKSQKGTSKKGDAVDEWTTVGSVGRGRAKQRTHDTFDNFAQGISGALPNVAPMGRGRGR